MPNTELMFEEQDEDITPRHQSKVDARAGFEAWDELERMQPPVEAAEGVEPAQEEESLTVGGVAKDIAEGIVEVPIQVVGGVMDAVNETNQTIKEMGDWFTNNVADLGAVKWGEDGIEFTSAKEIAEMPPLELPAPAEADSFTGSTIRNISQFLAGFFGAGKFLKGVKPLQSAGPIAKATAQGAVADFAAFDPHEERLSNLIQKSPALQNPVNEFLASDPEDSAAIGRFKNALEGAGLGLATDGLMMGLKSIKKARQARELAGPAKPEALTKQVEPTFDEKTARSLLGEEIDFGVPDSVVAKGAKSAGKKPVSIDKGEVFINFARIDTDEDVKALMRDLASTSKEGINKSRRGVRKWSQTKVSAEQENAFKILSERRKGEPLNAEQSLAVRELWVKSTSKVKELSELVAESPSGENIFAFRKMLAVHNSIQKQVISARTETARALNSWAIPAGEGVGAARQINDLVQQFGGAENAKDLAARIKALSDADMSNELDALIEGSAWAKTREAVAQVWINALLSGPHTHMRNIISQTAVIGQQVYERKAAELLTQSSGRAGVAMGEASAMVYGLVEGIKDSFRVSAKGRQIAKQAAARALKGSGSEARKLVMDNLDEFGTVIQSAATGRTGIGVGKVELPYKGALSAENLNIEKTTPVGRVMDFIDSATRVPGYMLGVEDEFFKTMGYRMELNAQALRKAANEVNEGAIKSDQLKARISEILQNPTDEIKISAMDNALYMTFTNQPAKVPADVVNSIGRVPVLGKIIMPFRRTPVNIGTYTFERTPLAPLVKTWRDDVLAGGARKDIALARFYTGNAILLAMADLAMSGHITGEGPSDPRQRSNLRRQGVQPASVRVKVGEGEDDYRFFNYRGMEPVATSMGLAANIVDILANTDWEDDQAEAEELVIAASMAIANQVTSQQYMSGVNEFFNAMSDPNRYGETWWNRLAGSVVPTGVAQITKTQDPYLRAVNDMADAIKARTPGLSETLPMRHDLWGRPIDRRSGLGSLYDAISPIYSKKKNPEPIDKELERLEKWIGKPPKKTSFDGITINLEKYPEAYERYVELSGNALTESIFGAPIDVSGKGAKDALNDLVQGGHPLSSVYNMYTDGPDGGKADYIQSILSKYRRAAKDQLLEEYPDIKEEFERKKSEKQGNFIF